MENRIKEAQGDLFADRMVRLDGRCRALYVASHRPRPHPVRDGDLRHDPAEALEARRAGEGERKARENRLRFGMSMG